MRLLSNRPWGRSSAVRRFSFGAERCYRANSIPTSLALQLCNSSTCWIPERGKFIGSTRMHLCTYALRQAVWLLRIRPPTGKLLHSCLWAMLQAARRSSRPSRFALQLRLGRFSGGFPRPSKQQMDQPS